MALDYHRGMPHIEALIPELPARWLHSAHVQRVELTNLMADMARSIGARGHSISRPPCFRAPIRMPISSECASLPF